MPTRLGQLIRRERLRRNITLRALARAIRKSPAFLVALETNTSPPSAAEETLRRIAQTLELDADRLITLAGKTPEDAAPTNELEAAIFRLVKGLPKDRQRSLLRTLQEETR